jgi:hypothetical protein
MQRLDLLCHVRRKTFRRQILRELTGVSTGSIGAGAVVETTAIGVPLSSAHSLGGVLLFPSLAWQGLI